MEAAVAAAEVVAADAAGAVDAAETAGSYVKVRYLKVNVRKEASMLSRGMATALLVVSTIAGFAGNARAHDIWPAIPPEIGVGSPAAYGWIPYRCVERPVANFYHGAWYGGEPPAIYRGVAYRPFYRYAAYRVMPRTYYCAP